MQGFRGKKTKKVILTADYLEAQRGADLKDFQDKALMWQKKVEEAEAELVSIQEKIDQSQKDHKQWLIDKTAEINSDIESLEKARAIAYDEGERQKADIDFAVEEAKKIYGQTVSSERRSKEEKEKAEIYFSDGRAARSDIEERQRKIESDILHNQRILNEIDIKIRKNKEILVSEEEKRHEIIQIEGRIDAGLERHKKTESSNEEISKKIAEQLKALKEKLAQADILARDQREFVSKQNAYDLWNKEKAAKETDQIARDNEQNARERSLRIMESGLKRRENIIKQLEKSQGGNDG